MKNDQQVTKPGISIQAIPMYNLPESPAAMHTKGRGNGYVLGIGEKYIHLRRYARHTRNAFIKNIDIAFVCMNLPYTMDVKEAANAVLAFKPKIVYPYHYRGKEGFSDTTEFKKSRSRG